MSKKVQKVQDAEAATGVAADNLETPEEKIVEDGEPGGVSHDDLLAAVSDAGLESEETADDEDVASAEVDDEEKLSQDDDDDQKERSRLGRKLKKTEDKLNGFTELISKQTEMIARLEGQISVLTKGHVDDTPDDDSNDEIDDEAVATIGTVRKLMEQAAKARASENEKESRAVTEYRNNYWKEMSVDLGITSKEDLDDLSAEDRAIYGMLIAKGDGDTGTEYNRVHTGDPAVDYLINKQAARISVLTGKKKSIPLREEKADLPPGGPGTPSSKKDGKPKPVDIGSLDKASRDYLTWLGSQDDMGDIGEFASEAMAAETLVTTRAKRG